MEMRLRDVLAKRFQVFISSKLRMCDLSVCMLVCVAAFRYMCTWLLNVIIVNMYHGNTVPKN